ncbi:MAG: CotH kinase family protein [Saprospiraceae bacterium]
MKKAILCLVHLSLLFTVVLNAQTTEMTKKGEAPEVEMEQKDFYDINTIRELRLTFSQKNWVDKLDSLRLYGNGSLLGAAKIDGKEYKDVGIRYRGSKSFRVGAKRNGYHIKMNFINKNQNHQGYKTLKLSNALRDPSMIREVMSYYIAGQYMPAPKANYVKLFINEEYVGIFVNVESIDDNFLEKNYSSSDNTFFKCSPDVTSDGEAIAGCKNKIFASLEYEKNAACYTANYEMKSKDGWDDLIELTRTLNEKPEDISKVLNVDEALWMLALNNVLVNLSSYSGQQSQNYYLYKSDNGRFHPIMWDMNLSFGSFKNTGYGSDLKLKELQKLDPMLHADHVEKPLISQLLKNPFYKKMYLSHIRTINYDHFVNGEYEKMARDLQRMISNDMFNDPNKFYNHNEFLGSLTNTTGKRSKIPGIIELMTERARYLKKHPELAIYPPEVSEVSVTGREKFAKNRITNFHIKVKTDNSAKRVYLMYRFNDTDDYQKMYMNDDGGSNDGKADDNLYATTIAPTEGSEKIDYYVVVENAKMVTFDPPNYMYEPHAATLGELNK